MDVWYVSYGSNMSFARFMCYLAGGRAHGANRDNPGARNPRPPAADRVVDLPGRVGFVGNSPQWDGGVAWYDHDSPGPSPGRAWLIEASQFEDLVAQENHVDVGTVRIAASLWDDGGTMDVPTYRRLIRLDDVEGIPSYTFTRSVRLDMSPPSDAYTRIIEAGLIEAGVNREAVRSYLADR